MRRSFLMAAAFALALPGGCRAGSAADSVATTGTVPLTIQSATRSHKFDVEVARTPEQQARGLMFRERLAPDRGMIFLLDPPRVASFWMKNVPISLDLIFIRADGTIESIAANAVPFSPAFVESGETVATVLEIAGGRAAQLGLAEGDRVSWPR